MLWELLMPVPDEILNGHSDVGEEPFGRGHVAYVGSMVKLDNECSFMYFDQAIARHGYLFPRLQMSYTHGDLQCIDHNRGRSSQSVSSALAIDIMDGAGRRRATALAGFSGPVHRWFPVHIHMLASEQRPSSRMWIRRPTRP